MNPNPFLKLHSGIYGIRHVTSNKIYVGKTKCMYRRCHQYIYDFKNRSIGHLNDYLYNAMCKHGIENFELFPLEFCSISECSQRELYWIEKLKSNIKDFGYNLRLDSSTGMIVHSETSKKISENLKKQWSEGVRKDHSNVMKKKWSNSPERKKTQSKIMSKVLTKWVYSLEYPDGRVINDLLYKELQDRGFNSSISSFHRKKCDEVICKGVKVIRRKI